MIPLRRSENKISTPTIRVAIIDDGIDPENGSIQIGDGKTFAADRDDSLGEFFVGCRGQGNLIASVINRVIPKALLYIARVQEHIEPNGSSQFSVLAATEVSLSHCERFN